MGMAVGLGMDVGGRGGGILGGGRGLEARVDGDAGIGGGGVVFYGRGGGGAVGGGGDVGDDGGDGGEVDWGDLLVGVTHVT
jgi:hypothetical protein